nr:MAG TPA: hypothetical protein [Caudoviricetes sp.]
MAILVMVAPLICSLGIRFFHSLSPWSLHWR